MNGFWQNYKEWAAKPFSEDMTATQWFLLIGFLLVCVVAWKIILGHLIEALLTSD